MVCLFCLSETNDGVSIFGESRVAKTVRNLIVQHFWFDVYEINIKDNYLCSKCWGKLEIFHEFYHTVKVTHRNRFKSKDDQLEVKSTTPDSSNETTVTGEQAAKLKNDSLHSQNKTEEQSNAINNSLHCAKKSVTIKKKTLKLNSNSCQSKEINFQIEKDGKNVRCNILKSTGVDKNGDEESESESETEHATIPNYPARQIKMEQELIIIDDGNLDDSMNEFNANTHTNTEDNDYQQSYENQQKQRKRKPKSFMQLSKCNICCKELLENSIADHQARKHKICRICKQTFQTYNEVLVHMLQCKRYCEICGRSFSRINSYNMHMKTHYPQRPPTDAELIRKTANEKVLKQWASMITQK